MRRVALVAVVGVLAASGAYALIYLFRWEWHRAIITALFFVAAEVGLGISVLLRRMARLEQRLDDLARAAPADALTVDPDVLARIQEAAPDAPRPFAWLDPRAPHLGVFLPFLLGVGALASGLAWVVEQLARRTTTPLLERRLAERLAPLSLPAGGLLAPAPAIVAPVPARSGAWRRAWPAVAFALIVGLGIATIDWLGDALQSRPDARRGDVATQIDVELRGARSEARPEQVATALWGTCSHVLHGHVGSPTIRQVGAGRIQLTIPTDVGPHAADRLRGCLQDAVVDRVQATVVAWEAIPSG